MEETSTYVYFFCDLLDPLFHGGGFLLRGTSLAVPGVGTTRPRADRKRGEGEDELDACESRATASLRERLRLAVGRCGGAAKNRARAQPATEGRFAVLCLGREKPGVGRLWHHGGHGAALHDPVQQRSRAGRAAGVWVAFSVSAWRLPRVFPQPLRALCL